MPSCERPVKTPFTIPFAKALRFDGTLADAANDGVGSLDGSLDNQQARESVEKMAREVLSNPIIEDYRVEIEA